MCTIQHWINVITHVCPLSYIDATIYRFAISRVLCLFCQYLNKHMSIREIFTIIYGFRVIYKRRDVIESSPPYLIHTILFLRNYTFRCRVKSLSNWCIELVLSIYPIVGLLCFQNYLKGTWENGILRWKYAHFVLLLQDTCAYVLVLLMISLTTRYQIPTRIFPCWREI